MTEAASEIELGAHEHGTGDRRAEGTGPSLDDEGEWVETQFWCLDHFCNQPSTPASSTSSSTSQLRAFVPDVHLMVPRRLLVFWVVFMSLSNITASFSTSPGGYLGLVNSSQLTKNKFVAIEFDTRLDLHFNDPCNRSCSGPCNRSCPGVGTNPIHYADKNKHGRDDLDGQGLQDPLTEQHGLLFTVLPQINSIN